MTGEDEAFIKFEHICPVCHVDKAHYHEATGSYYIRVRMYAAGAELCNRKRRVKCNT